jgi:hypothetical protein
MPSGAPKAKAQIITIAKVYLFSVPVTVQVAAKIVHRGAKWAALQGVQACSLGAAQRFGL